MAREQKLFSLPPPHPPANCCRAPAPRAACPPFIDIPTVAEEVVDALALIKRITRICYSHIKRFVLVLGLYLIAYAISTETPEDVEEFKLWIRTLPDPNGVLLRSS
ncbi:hypothetical protein C8R44DRAFT_870490 [Mycena epipterygia]|nr:hypothetical protein C8R44DRAFT_870490 [Mycena epipterygia]